MNNINPEKLKKTQFEMHVRQYQGLVFSIAFGILLNRQESMDILQNTFLKAFLQKNFLDDSFDRKNWLIRVTRNNALNNRKSWWRKIQLLAGYKDCDQESLSPELSEFFARQQTIVRLREAMQELSDDERDLITLRFVAQYKYEQIAELLQTPIGTIMSRLARLKKKMGTLMGDENYE